MKNISSPIVFLFLILLFGACAKKDPPVRGFYYWKTQFVLNQNEASTLQALKASSLYIRIFDVDWDFNFNQAIPKGSQTKTPIFPQGMSPIPTIYLTNRSLKRTTLNGIDTLAQKILQYTDEILKDWSVQPTKIQLDADWTNTTQKKYFKLILLIQASKKFKKVSTTIRLHQYKYPKKTGIPPADEGILMCYNTGKIKDWRTDNSIATEEDITQYLTGKKAYPIPLGVAFPIFSWTVIYRDSLFFKIVSDSDLSWQQDTLHYQKLTSNRYVVKNNTYLSGHYLYEGDLLRYEFIEPKELQSFALRLNKRQYFQEVLFYHLEEQHLDKYGEPKLEAVFKVFE